MRVEEDEKHATKLYSVLCTLVVGNVLVNVFEFVKWIANDTHMWSRKKRENQQKTAATAKNVQFYKLENGKPIWYVAANDIATKMSL